MNDYKVTWSARSLKDLDQAHDLLAQHSLEAANRTIEFVLERWPN
jgi:hypothetical protein